MCVPARGNLFFKGGGETKKIKEGDGRKQLWVDEFLFLVRGMQFFFLSKVIFNQSSSSIKVRLPYRVVFYLKSPIFILQRAYIPKSGVEFRQQTNSDNRTGVATSREVALRKGDIHTY